MSKIQGVFFKDQNDQTSEERMLARRFLLALLGVVALAIFIIFVVSVWTDGIKKTGPAAEIKELDILAKGCFIGLVGFALLAMAFGKRYVDQILMLVVALAGEGVVLYLGWKYANPTIQLLGVAGFIAWVIAQGAVILRGLKRILSGDDPLLKGENDKSSPS